MGPTRGTASSVRARVVAATLIALVCGLALAITGTLSRRSLDRLTLLDIRMQQTGDFSGLRIRLQRQAFELMPAFLPGDDALVEDVRVQLLQARELGTRLPANVFETIDRLVAVLGVPLVARRDLVAAAALLERVTEAEAAAQERLLADAGVGVRRERAVAFGGILSVSLLLILAVWLAPKRVAAPLRPLIRFWLRGALDQRRTTIRLARMALASEAAASLAHEIRNPLAGVALGLQNLEREHDSLSGRIRPMVGELERVSRTLNDHLQALRGPSEAPSEVDVGRMLEDLAELLGYEAEAGVTVSAVSDARLRCRVKQDQLRQCVLNLGLNGLQAVETPGGQVRFSAARSGDAISIRVSDTGPGFPANILSGEQLPLTSDRPGGSGLGLRIVRRAVAELGGALHLTNPPEGGATAEIRIPCGRSV